MPNGRGTTPPFKTTIAHGYLLLSLASRFGFEVSAIQSHGGIGFTWEANVHWLYKRAQLNTALLGGVRRHHAVCRPMCGAIGQPAPGLAGRSLGAPSRHSARQDRSCEIPQAWRASREPVGVVLGQNLLGAHGASRSTIQPRGPRR